MKGTNLLVIKNISKFSWSWSVVQVFLKDLLHVLSIGCEIWELLPNFSESIGMFVTIIVEGREDQWGEMEISNSQLVSADKFVWSFLLESGFVELKPFWEFTWKQLDAHVDFLEHIFFISNF